MTERMITVASNTFQMLNTYSLPCAKKSMKISTKKHARNMVSTWSKKLLICWFINNSSMTIAATTRIAYEPINAYWAISNVLESTAFTMRRRTRAKKLR